MIVSDQIDHVADRYAAGYSQFLRALIGVMSKAMTSPNALEPKTFSMLTVESFEVAAEFLMSHQLHLDGEAVMVEAISAAGGLDPENDAILRDHVWAQWSGSQALLSDAVTKDRLEARTVFRRFAFDASLRSAAHGPVGGLIAARLKHMPIKAAFAKTDRIGRSLSAHTHVRTLVRGALIGSYVDAYLFTLMANGIDKARIVYPDQSHEDHGLVFSIDGSGPSMPSFEDIRAQIFHPNSTARLEPATE